MKRILAMGVLATVVATSLQAQVTKGAGSNFTGPGGGGAGVTGGLGAFNPTIAGSSIGGGGFSGGPTISSFAGASGPTIVNLGSGANRISVTVSASDQRAVASAVGGGTPNNTPNTAAFLASLGTFGSTPQGQALANALAAFGNARNTFIQSRGSGSTLVVARTALISAVNAFNDAVQALPAGATVPPSMIAARALLGNMYVSR